MGSIVAVLEIALVEIAQSGDGLRPRTGAGAGSVDEQRRGDRGGSPALIN
jgi:hypothetical protein